MGEVGWKIGERRGFYGDVILWSLNRGKDCDVYYIEENFWDYKIVEMEQKFLMLCKFDLHRWKEIFRDYKIVEI